MLTPAVTQASSRKRSLFRHLLRRLLFLLLGVVVIFLALILVLRFVNPPISAFMIGYQLGPYERPLQQEWVDIEAMSPWLPLAVIASEDQKFQDHWGFDFASIGHALESYQQGGDLRGASTISQQTTKNLFLWPAQNLLRKGLEAGLTAMVELLWPKRRIMEVYLNLAEFGKGIYGVEAASRHFFGVPARALTARQAALLAAVLPSPKRFHVKAPSPYIRNRVDWIRQQMRQLGGLDFVAGLNGH